MDSIFAGTGRRLRALRISRNENIDRISALCGITRAWYFDLEDFDYEISGNMRIRAVVLICALMNTTANELVLGQEYNGKETIAPLQLRDIFLSRSDEDQTRLK